LRRVRGILVVVEVVVMVEERGQLEKTQKRGVRVVKVCHVTEARRARRVRLKLDLKCKLV
jgi:hypothetical protein